MDREKKKKVAAAIAALVYLRGGEEAGKVSPSRWAALGREQIMLDRARVMARR